MEWWRSALGAAIWMAVLVAGWWALAGYSPQSAARWPVVDQLWHYASGRRSAVELDFRFPATVQPGDPIFVVGQGPTVRQVGEVTGVRRDAEAVVAQAIFYASAPAVDERARVSFHETPASMSWVLQTILPEEKRRAVADELQTALAAHQDELLAALRPVIEQGLQEAFRVVEQDLPAAIARRRQRLEEIGGRYQQEIVQRELVPMVRKEIWPIVLRHAEPAANEMGREIWEQASLWRFGWRYAYDKSFLPERNLTRQEWQRFVSQDAAPLLEDHTEDFVRIQQRILSDVARNPMVRATARKSLGRVLEDPQVQAIAWEIIQEVVVENPRMHAVLVRQWQSEQARAALAIAAARLEPTALRIGELLLGTPEKGVTPEFARVLRNQILGKDRRWLVLETFPPEPGESPAAALPARLPVSRGPADALHPFVREPLVFGTG